MPLLRPTMVLGHFDLPDEPTFIRKLSLNRSEEHTSELQSQ